MQTLVVATLLWGQATYYNPGVFAQVWDYREHRMPACTRCVGFAAMAREEDLGREIWVYNPKADEWIGPLYVIDCAAPQDRPQMQARGRIVELPFWLAERWHMEGPIEVAVSNRSPAKEEHLKNRAY